MKSLYLALLLATLFVAAGACAEGLQIESFKLKNGMEVYYIPSHKVPAVSHAVWYRAGAGEDLWGKSGVAHFLEHMMFRGTKQIAAGEFSKIISRNGGRDNAFTSYDLTAYFQIISNDKLPLVMQMESERMQGALLDEKQFNNEKKVILEERRQTVESSPTRLLYEEMSALLYRNHPYGRPVLGFEEEIRALTLADLQAFYRKYYCPSNAILIVAGDVEKQEVMNLAEKNYGKIPACEPNTRKRNAVPKNESRKWVELESSLVKHPYWLKMYPAPSETTDGKEHASALVVLSAILGSDKTGRLYQRLIEKDKLATEASSGYDDVSLDKTSFSVSVVPTTLDNMPAIKKAVDDELERFTKELVTDEELARAKNSIISDVVYSREGLFNLARAVGFVLTSGLDKGYILNWDKKIDAVTKEQIQAAAKSVFRDDEDAVSGIMKPKVNTAENKAGSDKK